MAVNIFLLSLLVLISLWTVMTIRLIRSIVGLAFVSVIVSLLMYRLNSPLAAVFELSVCAGLIPVIFITTVSFTQRVSKERLRVRRKERLAKFWLLPFLVVIMGALLTHYLKWPQFFAAATPESHDVRGLIWNLRHLDLLGQVVILLTGVFGVVILFKESAEK